MLIVLKDAWPRRMDVQFEAALGLCIILIQLTDRQWLSFILHYLSQIVYFWQVYSLLWNGREIDLVFGLFWGDFVLSQRSREQGYRHALLQATFLDTQMRRNLLLVYALEHGGCFEVITVPTSERHVRGFPRWRLTGWEKRWWCVADHL